MKGALSEFRVATRNPEIRRLQVGFAASSIAYWAASIAVTVFAYEAGGATAVALQLILRMVPSAVAAPLLSTLADRHPRVTIMVATDALRISVLIAMAALIVAGAPPITVYLGSAIVGILGSAFEPAKQALLPDLARTPEELTAANVVGSGIDSTSFFAGPAIGGLLLAAASPQLVLVVTAVAVAGSALLVWTIREPGRGEDVEGEGGREPFLSAVRTGLATVVREPPVRLVVGVMAAQLVVAGLEGTLLVALAIDVLDLGDGGVGYLSSVLGVGGLLGAVAAITLVGRRRMASVLGIGCLLWGVPFVLIGTVPEVAVAVLALGVVGVANSVVDVSSTTLLQRIAPPEVLGRVFGVLESLGLAAYAVGAALAPVLIELVEIEGALIAQGAFLPVVVAVCWMGLRRLDALADRGLAATGDVLGLLRGDPLFAPLPAPVIERLAKVATRVTVPAGAVVFSQGDVGDCFYLVDSGRVAVEIDGRKLGEQSRGESFGEIALLRDTPRTATVHALTDLELVALDRDEFVPAVTGYPSSAAAADRVVARRTVFGRRGALAT